MPQVERSTSRREGAEGDDRRTGLGQRLLDVEAAEDEHSRAPRGLTHRQNQLRGHAGAQPPCPCPAPSRLSWSPSPRRGVLHRRDLGGHGRLHRRRDRRPRHGHHVHRRRARGRARPPAPASCRTSTAPAASSPSSRARTSSTTAGTRSASTPAPIRRPGPSPPSATPPEPSPAGSAPSDRQRWPPSAPRASFALFCCPAADGDEPRPPAGLVGGNDRVRSAPCSPVLCWTDATAGASARAPGVRISCDVTPGPCGD